MVRRAPHWAHEPAVDLRETGDHPRHPWEVARCGFLLAALRRHGVLGQCHSVLDGGAGDAWLARQLLAQLPPDAHVTCWDTEYTPQVAGPIEAAGAGRLQCAVDRPTTTFDLVTLLDVAEHVPDDVAFLSAVVGENLKSGGYLLFTVPAWQALFTGHDTFLQHHRRYAPQQAQTLLTGAGLQIVADGGLFHSLLVPRTLEKLRETALGPPKQSSPGIAWRGGKVLTATVATALALDNAVSMHAARLGLQLPGLSYWALCRK